MNEPYSVLISVYDKETPENLKQSLQSLHNQTLEPNEIVLVEDGALNEGLERAIEEIRALHPEVYNIVKLEANVGLGGALNAGLEACKNEYVARMDSDDICPPNRMEVQMNFMREHPEIDILSGVIEEFDGDITHVYAKRVVPLKDEDIWQFAKTRSPFNHAAVMYKKSAVLSVGGYRTDLKRVEDHELWMRMHRHGFKGANLSETLLYVRAGDDVHRRKHGSENAKALYKFYTELYKSSEISLPRYIFDISCACSLQLMPAWLHKFSYKLIRLKQTPYEARRKKADKLNVRPLNQDELIEAQIGVFEIYSDVKKLCDQQGLTLMLGGGSCLGAVRHLGYIPWDDDMDCVMPRADYERLKLVFDSALGEKYALQVPNLKNHIASNLFMKVVKRDGQEYLQEQCLSTPGAKGLWLDIVPMDYAPENPFKRVFKGIELDALNYLAVSRFILKFKTPLYASIMKQTFSGRLVYYIRNALGFLMSFKDYSYWYNLFDRLSRQSEESSLVTFPAGRRHYLGECMKTEVFLPAATGEFEGESAYLPAKAHTYLRHMYGADYMKPPEEAKQISHLLKPEIEPAETDK